MLRVENLVKWFPVKGGIFQIIFPSKRKYVKAVDKISFEVKKGEVFGLVGESGCGKTTTGRTILDLAKKTSGNVYFEDREISELRGNDLKNLRRNMQIIFQNPFEVLEPRISIFNLLSEPLEFHGLASRREEKIDRVMKLLNDVGLTPAEAFITRYPYELSGGQMQRLAMARALILQPKFVVADEPVSMLDVSIRSGILKLLLDLRKTFGLTYLFITHDLAVARFICDRVAVMYLGKIVEVGKAGQVLVQPLHPYTKALRSVLPSLDAVRKHYKDVDKVITGEVPDPVDLPPGCRFHPRCLYTKAICCREEPPLIDVRGGSAACHFVDSIN